VIGAYHKCVADTVIRFIGDGVLVYFVEYPRELTKRVLSWGRAEDVDRLYDQLLSNSERILKQRPALVR
jgi:hypothetical protein